METDFSDKSGKPIYIGDIVQYRLSDAGTLLKVVKTKKGIKLVNPQCTDGNLNQVYRGSVPLNKSYEKYVSIVDTSERQNQAIE